MNLSILSPGSGTRHPTQLNEKPIPNPPPRPAPACAPPRGEAPTEPGWPRPPSSPGGDAHICLPPCRPPAPRTPRARTPSSTIPFPFSIPLAKAGAVALGLRAVRDASYGGRRQPRRLRGEPPGPQRRRRHGRRSGRRAPPPPPAQGVLPGRQVSHPQRPPASFLSVFSFSARASSSSSFIVLFPTILPPVLRLVRSAGLRSGGTSSGGRSWGSRCLARSRSWPTQSLPSSTRPSLAT